MNPISCPKSWKTKSKNCLRVASQLAEMLRNLLAKKVCPLFFNSNRPEIFIICMYECEVYLINRRICGDTMPESYGRLSVSNFSRNWAKLQFFSIFLSKHGSNVKNKNMFRFASSICIFLTICKRKMIKIKNRNKSSNFINFDRWNDQLLHTFGQNKIIFRNHDRTSSLRKMGI